jgi:DNA-binding response OmpR family regulator
VSHDPEQGPKRLLVVSDDGQVREELRYGLPADFEVDLATDAREAWTHMSETIPWAVVVDLQTGSAGGYGLARDMSEDARLAHVPVVMLLERPQDEWLAKQAGAAAYLVKPVNAQHILKALSQLTESA